MLAVAGLAAATARPAAGAAFTPKSIAGAYRGAWTNQTFGVSGSFAVTIRSQRRNRVLSMSASVGGTGFGCPGVPAFSGISMTKGSGNGHWNAAGFRFKRSGTFGSLDVRYVHAGGRLTATGTAPPCAAGVTYTIAATVKGGVIAGKATIKLASQTATTTFRAATGGGSHGRA